MVTHSLPSLLIRGNSRTGQQATHQQRTEGQDWQRSFIVVERTGTPRKLTARQQRSLLVRLYKEAKANGFADGRWKFLRIVDWLSKCMLVVIRTPASAAA